MKYRLKDAIENIEFDELVKMKKDLDSGGLQLKKFINARIREEKKNHAQFCSNCYNNLEPNSVNNYTLLFGPEDFKKKASFCGMDCLEFFMKELKELKKVVR